MRVIGASRRMCPSLCGHSFSLSPAQERGDRHVSRDRSAKRRRGISQSRYVMYGMPHRAYIFVGFNCRFRRRRYTLPSFTGRGRNALNRARAMWSTFRTSVTRKGYYKRELPNFNLSRKLRVPRAFVHFASFLSRANRRVAHSRSSHGINGHRRS